MSAVRREWPAEERLRVLAGEHGWQVKAVGPAFVTVARPGSEHSIQAMPGGPEQLARACDEAAALILRKANGGHDITRLEAA